MKQMKETDNDAELSVLAEKNSNFLPIPDNYEELVTFVEIDVDHQQLIDFIRISILLIWLVGCTYGFVSLWQELTKQAFPEKLDPGIWAFFYLLTLSGVPYSVNTLFNLIEKKVRPPQKKKKRKVKYPTKVNPAEDLADISLAELLQSEEYAD